MILTGHGHSLAAIHQENIPCLSISNFQSWCTREKQEIPDINPYFLIVTAASEAYPKYFVWVQLFEPPTATQHRYHRALAKIWEERSQDVCLLPITTSNQSHIIPRSLNWPVHFSVKLCRFSVLDSQHRCRPTIKWQLGKLGFITNCTS